MTYAKIYIINIFFNIIILNIFRSNIGKDQVE